MQSFINIIEKELFSNNSLNSISLVIFIELPSNNIFILIKDSSKLNCLSLDIYFLENIYKII